MKKNILILGLLVLFCFPILGNAQVESVDFTEPALANHWEYTYERGVDLNSSFYNVDTHLTDYYNTSVGAFYFNVDLNYTMYWENGFDPGYVLAEATLEWQNVNSTIDIFDLGESNVLRVVNTTELYANITCGGDTDSALYSDELRTLNYTDIYWSIDTLTTVDNTTMLNFTIPFTVFDFDIGPTIIDFVWSTTVPIVQFPNGYHNMSGEYHLTIVDVDGTYPDATYNLSYYIYLEAPSGAMLFEDEGYLSEQTDVGGLLTYIDFIGYNPHYDRADIWIGDNLIPVYERDEYNNAYSLKSGIMVYERGQIAPYTYDYTPVADVYNWFAFSEANFEVAFTDDPAVMTIDDTTYALDGVTSFIIDVALNNSAEMGHMVNITVAGSGFSGNDSLNMTPKSTAFGQLNVSVSKETTGTYQFEVQLFSDYVLVQTEVITVNILSLPTTETTTTTTTTGTETTGPIGEGGDLTIMVASGLMGIGVIVASILLIKRR
jgi:hypothetical protein